MLTQSKLMKLINLQLQQCKLKTELEHKKKYCNKTSPIVFIHNYFFIFSTFPEIDKSAISEFFLKIDKIGLGSQSQSAKCFNKFMRKN